MSQEQALSIFERGGETGRLMAALDWSQTSLGPFETWSAGLLGVLNTIMPAGWQIVLFWGPDYVALYNDTYAPTIGSKHPHVLGQPARIGWAELWDDLKTLLDTVRTSGKTLAGTDRPFYIERHGFREEAFFDISYSAVHEADGSVGGVLCIVNDTSERVRAARNSRAERDRMGQMFEQSPGFVAVLRAPGHIFEIANAAYRRLIDREDVIGKSLAEVLPEVVEQGFVGLMDQVVETGTPYGALGQPVSLRRADGTDELRYLDFIYQPITDDDGRVTAIFVGGADVTERIEAEQALSLSESTLRLATEAAEIGTWDIHVASGIMICSDRTREMFGISSSRPVLLSDFRACLHPDDLAPTEAALTNALDPDVRAAYDVEYRTIGLDDGQLRWVAAKGRGVFGADGKCQRAIGTAIDITERKAIEDALLESEARLERGIAERTAELVRQIEERERVEATLRQMQRLEAVGQLTSGVAHDFNNLLTVVLGNIDMIQREAGLNERVSQRLGHVRTAADRGATLTAQLLAFSRRQRLEARSIDLNETVAGMRDLLQSSMGGSVRLETELHPGLWPALVDPTQIEMMILNLAINARDAMEVGGALTVETRNVTRGNPVRAEEPSAGDYVMVAVSDSGTGMTHEVLAHAFEPFFTTKPVGKGSGLGLAQVFGFAKQSGGGVAIETELGKGTTVRVFLPRAEATAEAEAQVSASDGGGLLTGKRVLVVDDDDAVRELTGALLGELGCVVTNAPNGEAALAALGGQAFDLLVLDFAMPGMNGAELARRAGKAGSTAPILFVTGYADLGAIRGVEEERIVQKPFRGGDFERKVRRLLEN